MSSFITLKEPCRWLIALLVTVDYLLVHWVCLIFVMSTHTHPAVEDFTVMSTNSNLMQAETTCPMKIFIFALLSCIFGNAYLVSYPTQYCSTLIHPHIGRSIHSQQKTEAFLKLPYVLGLWVHFPIMEETWKFLEIWKHPLPSVAGDVGEATTPFCGSCF